MLPGESHTRRQTHAHTLISDAIRSRRKGVAVSSEFSHKVKGGNVNQLTPSWDYMWIVGCGGEEGGGKTGGEVGKTKERE